MPDNPVTSAVPFRLRIRWVFVILAVAGAVLLHLAAQLSMLLTRADWSIGAFRNYFASDQLSYMGIVADAAHGRFGNFEPFTETGSIYYPRFYYLVVGAGAHLFGIQAVTAWQIAGILCQVVLVAAVALTCVLVSGKVWTGLLGAGPFVLGTFSTVTDQNWFTSLDSHAVLWGPYGVLFTQNAETAGLCAGGVALLLLLVVYTRVSARMPRIVLTSLAALIIGAMANVQTYAFLALVFLAIYVFATYGVVTAKAKWPLYLSLVFLPVLYWAGPTIARSESPLATLVFGLLPAVPGIVILLLRSRGVGLIYVAVLSLAASPAVLGTIIGLAHKDPFLVYRVSSSKDLGVEWPAGLIAAIVLAVPLLLIFIAGLHRRRPLWTGFSAGISIAWVVLATNDIWGANQEPYRFWIDCFTLVALSTLPIFIMVVQEYLAPRSQLWVQANICADSEPHGRRPIGRSSRVVALISLAVVALLVVVSLHDWERFYRSDGYQGLISYSGPREQAIRIAAEKAGQGLILPDPCIDPQTLKIVSGARVVYMNAGMAWPAKYQDISTLGADRAQNTINLSAASNAGVNFVITDTACAAGWPSEYANALTRAGSARYGSGEIVLWRFGSSLH